MASNFKSILALGVGFAGGWAARSLADSPQGVGVKLLEVAMTAKEKLSRWAAVESERLEDMFAEAHSKVTPADISQMNGHMNGASKRTKPQSVKTRVMSGDA